MIFYLAKSNHIFLETIFSCPNPSKTILKFMKPFKEQYSWFQSWRSRIQLLILEPIYWNLEPRPIQSYMFDRYGLTISIWPITLHDISLLISLLTFKLLQYIIFLNSSRCFEPKDLSHSFWILYFILFGFYLVVSWSGGQSFIILVGLFIFWVHCCWNYSSYSLIQVTHLFYLCLNEKTLFHNNPILPLSKLSNKPIVASINFALSTQSSTCLWYHCQHKGLMKQSSSIVIWLQTLRDPPILQLSLW